MALLPLKHYIMRSIEIIFQPLMTPLPRTSCTVNHPVPVARMFIAGALPRARVTEGGAGVITEVPVLEYSS